MTSSGIPLEIERKYLIRMPDPTVLSRQPGYSVSEIEQTYLPDPAPGVTERIRLRRYPDRVEYTHTVKIRVSSTEAREDESEITADEYSELLSRRDPALQTVCKTRTAFYLDGRPYEVDVYPFWTRTAVLETELPDAARPSPIPPFLSVIREVTGEPAYTNRNLARRIPPEPTEL
ncbi:MAG: hypothetical protein J6X72_00080 [Clostridia bacterium]|nr:hypothetical protein [Clostridia bacterium]